MVHTPSLARLVPRPGLVLAVIAFVFLSTLWISCAGVGACVPSGGQAPNDCKDGWTQAECNDWNTQGVNNSAWYFHAGQSCASLGY
jgi:hypothetical protein